MSCYVQFSRECEAHEPSYILAEGLTLVLGLNISLMLATHHLCISSWFYARGFKRVILNKGANDTISDWPTDGERVEKFRLAVSKGLDEAVLEECRRVYGDRSVARKQYPPLHSSTYTEYSPSIQIYSDGDTITPFQ